MQQINNARTAVRKNRGKIIGGLILVGFAFYGLFAAVNNARAYLDPQQWKPVEMVDPAKVSSIFYDVDGNPNNGFEQQIVVTGSLQSFYNSDADTFMLIVAEGGTLPLPETEE